METVLNQDYLCCKCQRVLFNPVKHTLCQNHFCEDCINNILLEFNEFSTCPKCNQYLREGQLQPNLFLHSAIMITDYRCKCGEVFKYSKLNSHVCVKVKVENDLRNMNIFFNCGICPFQSSNAEDIISHYKSTHQNQSGVCPICKQMPWGNSNSVIPNTSNHLCENHGINRSVYYQCEDEYHQMKNTSYSNR